MYICKWLNVLFRIFLVSLKFKLADFKNSNLKIIIKSQLHSL